MYGYYEYSDITAEQLLQKVKQERIFEMVLKEPFSYDKKYFSPFRKDKTPGCFFTQREDGTILFVDFADRTGHRHRSCFRMVMDAYEPTLSLSNAIDVICDYFKLSKNSSDYTPVSFTRNFTSVTEEKEGTIITYTKKREFSRNDRIYWSKFLITTQNLLEDNVYPVDRFTKVNRKGKFSSVCYNPSFALDFIHHVKLYFPLNNIEFKWLSNCDENDIGNIDNLPITGSKLIISKAYKDHRVIRNLTNNNVIWFQNEGCVPDDYILKMLLKRFHEIVIFFDNDYTGIKQGYKIVTILKKLSKGKNIVRMVYLPIKSKYKDIAEYVGKEGRQDTLKILKQIKL